MCPFFFVAVLPLNVKNVASVFRIVSLNKRDDYSSTFGVRLRIPNELRSQPLRAAEWYVNEGKRRSWRWIVFSLDRCSETQISDYLLPYVESPAGTCTCIILCTLYMYVHVHTPYIWAQLCENGAAHMYMYSSTLYTIFPPYIRKFFHFQVNLTFNNLTANVKCTKNSTTFCPNYCAFVHGVRFLLLFELN